MMCLELRAMICLVAGGCPDIRSASHVPQGIFFVFLILSAIDQFAMQCTNHALCGLSGLQMEREFST
jgi:hypothetical protein